MINDKSAHSIRQIESERIRYAAETEAEGKAIVAACWAATRIWDLPVYLDHTVSTLSANISGYWEEVESGTDLPEGTSFFQVIIVGFRGGQESFIMVHLEGILKQGEIKWRIKYLSAPGHERILSEEELRKFS